MLQIKVVDINDKHNLFISCTNPLYNELLEKMN